MSETYSKCWNEACFLYGQYQPCDEEDPYCEECGQPLRDAEPNSEIAARGD